MKFSEAWLRTWVNPEISSDALIEQLSMAGLEVDSVSPVAADFSGVVIGEIKAVDKHENADNLYLCAVNVGDDELNIVTNLPDVCIGQRVPVAVVGAVLDGGLKIKPRKLQGVESQGMFCSTKTLGISEQEALLDFGDQAMPGQDVRAFLALDDKSIEIDLTPNRSDCLSVAGIARDIGVLNQIDVCELEIVPVDSVKQKHQIEINIDAPDDCPRYLGRVIKNVNANAETPLWMRERLRRSGINPISVIVDIANYVMLELGQPMHAFDLEKLSGKKVIVRRAKSGEALVLLDGKAASLDERFLVIADDTSPVAVAGIMGGLDSAVTDATQDIFLESAHFSPAYMLGKPRALSMATDSSYRFERGVDYTLPAVALERATQLILDVAGGEPGPASEAVHEANLPAERQIVLRNSRAERVLGVPIEPARVADIMSRLGLTLKETGAGEWLVNVPSYRFDIAYEIDLIEEIARVYGYNNIPEKRINAQAIKTDKSQSSHVEKKLRELFVSRGFSEAVTFSFLDKAWQARFEPSLQPMHLSNPISSDLTTMRTSVFPGLVKAVANNIHRQQPRVKLFELGMCFVPKSDGALFQDVRLCAVAVGPRYPESWANDKAPIDFFDLKGELDALLHANGFDVANEARFTPTNLPGLHPGQTADVAIRGEHAGIIAVLHPSLGKELGIDLPVCLFELSLQSILNQNRPKYRAVSKFPSVRRDMAFVVDKEISADAVFRLCCDMGDDLIRNTVVFDVYEGPELPQGKKSLGLGFVLQDPNRTLEEDEVQLVMDKLVKALEESFKATVRS